MTDLLIKEERDGEFIEEKITVDPIPDLGDRTGLHFLDKLEKAVVECRKLIAQGFRLTDFWSDPDQGTEFTLKKEKKGKTS